MQRKWLGLLIPLGIGEGAATFIVYLARSNNGLIKEANISLGLRLLTSKDNIRMKQDVRQH